MAEINVTPFVDVMLVLLIVFMVTAPLLTVGVPVDLPKTKAQALSQDREPLSISVKRGGQIYLQNTPIAEEDLIAFYRFPREHWTKLRSTNPLERFNREIGRRTDVVGIFPDDASVIRLVSMLAIEANDEWLVGRAYISQKSMAAVFAARTETTITTNNNDKEVGELIAA